MQLASAAAIASGGDYFVPGLRHPWRQGNLHVDDAETEEEERERAVWAVAELVTEEIQNQLHALNERVCRGLTAFELSDSELSESYARRKQRRVPVIDLDQERPGSMAQTRKRRSGVEDRWHRNGEGVPCVNAGHGKLGTRC